MGSWLSDSVEQFSLNLISFLDLFGFSGCGDGAGSECGEREGMDNRVGYGRPICSGRAGPWLRYGACFHIPVVTLHQISTASDARGVHVQRLRPAHHAGYQSSCLYRWHRLCSGIYSFLYYWIQNLIVVGKKLSFLFVWFSIYSFGDTKPDFNPS